MEGGSSALRHWSPRLDSGAAESEILDSNLINSRL